MKITVYKHIFWQLTIKYKSSLNIVNLIFTFCCLCFSFFCICFCFLIFWNKSINKLKNWHFMLANSVNLLCCIFAVNKQDNKNIIIENSYLIIVIQLPKLLFLISMKISDHTLIFIRLSIQVSFYSYSFINTFVCVCWSFSVIYLF